MIKEKRKGVINMNFKIEDILNNTVDGVSKEELETVISEVIKDGICNAENVEEK